jgi:hypothetical protein
VDPRNGYQALLRCVLVADLAANYAQRGKLDGRGIVALGVGAKRQMFRKLVVSFDLGGTLMRGATQRVAHYPFQ